MEIVCNKCGYNRQLGTTVGTKEVFICTECQSTDVKLVDTSGVNVSIDGATISNILKDVGVNKDTIVDIVMGLAQNISVYDIFGFLAKQGQIKEEDKDKDGDK